MRRLRSRVGLWRTPQDLIEETQDARRHPVDAAGRMAHAAAVPQEADVATVQRLVEHHIG
jgi:hypothetical protein